MSKKHRSRRVRQTSANSGPVGGKTLKGGNLFIQNVEVDKDDPRGPGVWTDITVRNKANAITPGDSDSCNAGMTRGYNYELIVDYSWEDESSTQTVNKCIGFSLIENIDNEISIAGAPWYESGDVINITLFLPGSGESIELTFDINGNLTDASGGNGNDEGENGNNGNGENGNDKDVTKDDPISNCDANDDGRLSEQEARNCGLDDIADWIANNGPIKTSGDQGDMTIEEIRNALDISDDDDEEEGGFLSNLSQTEKIALGGGAGLALVMVTSGGSNRIVRRRRRRGRKSGGGDSTNE